MARELLVSHTTGTNVYATIRLPLDRNQASGGNIGYWWNTVTAVRETFVPGNWANYDIVMTELGNTGLFEGNIPAGLNPEKALEVIFWERLGGVPAMTDTKIAGVNFEFPDEWVATSSLRV